MKEAQLESAIIECAQLLGWKVAHFRPARTDKGWRTPVSADGVGFPDLVMARHGQVIFAELKAEKGKLSQAQHGWLRELTPTFAGGSQDPTHMVFHWFPSDWVSGTIEAVLRRPHPWGKSGQTSPEDSSPRIGTVG